MNLNEEEKVELAEYQKIKELQKYAEDFFKQLKEEMFSTIDLEILPIKFVAYKKKNKDSDEWLGGEVLYKGKQVVVMIYDIELTQIEELKQYIRHELCHYTLWIVGLENLDNSAAFWILAEYYKAHPYLELEDIQKILYDEGNFIIRNHKNENLFFRTVIVHLGLYVKNDKYKNGFENWFLEEVDKTKATTLAVNHKTNLENSYLDIASYELQIAYEKLRQFDKDNIPN